MMQRTIKKMAEIVAIRFKVTLLLGF